MNLYKQKEELDQIGKEIRQEYGEICLNILQKAKKEILEIKIT